MNHEGLNVVVVCRAYGHWLLGFEGEAIKRMIVMIFPSNEECEKKAKDIRSYNLPMNEDKMN